MIQSRGNNNTHASSTYHIDKNKLEENSGFLRDKSASYNVGLDSTPRPCTVIGLANRKKSFKDKEDEVQRWDRGTARKKVNFDEQIGEMKTKLENEVKMESKADLLEVKLAETNLNEDKSLSVSSLSSVTGEIGFIDEGKELTDRSNMTSDDLSSTGDKPEDLQNDNKDTDKPVAVLIKDPSLADINVHSMIKKFDEPVKAASPKPRALPRTQIKKTPEVHQKPMVPPRNVTTKLRGRLDKSHSTPAYDLTG